MALTQVSSGMLGNTGVTAGTYGGANTTPVVTVNAEGQVTTASNVPFSGITSTQLASTGVSSGTYGGSSTIPVLTVNAQGQVTSAANVSVSSTAVYANSGQLTANAATGTVALGLATTAVTAGSYGGATLSSITVDAYGRITAAANVANASLCCITASACANTPVVCASSCYVFPDGTCQTSAAVSSSAKTWTQFGGICTGLCCYTVPSGKTSVRIYAVGAGGSGYCTDGCSLWTYCCGGGGGGGGMAFGNLSVSPGCIVCACFKSNCVQIIYGGVTVMVACPGTCPTATSYCLCATASGGTACICTSYITNGCAYTGGSTGTQTLGGGGASAASPLGNGFDSGSSFSGAGIGGGIGCFYRLVCLGSFGTRFVAGGGGAGGGASFWQTGGSSTCGSGRGFSTQYTDPLICAAIYPGVPAISLFTPYGFCFNQPGSFCSIFCSAALDPCTTVYQGPAGIGPGSGGGAAVFFTTSCGCYFTTTCVCGGTGGDFAGGGGAVNVVSNCNNGACAIGGTGGLLGGGGAAAITICCYAIYGCMWALGGTGGCGGGGGLAFIGNPGCYTIASYCTISCGGCATVLIYA